VWIVTAAERLTQEFGPQGWEGAWAAMAWVHDEVQVAARLQIADVVGRLLIESIEEAGRILKFNVPITGEMKIGKTWADTH
jgi:DNA polymerase I-like protein with 3'-5' exonuclease and polymerase domains